MTPPPIPGQHVSSSDISSPAHKNLSEFRVEYLNPPYMTVSRPKLFNVPKKIAYNTKFHADISVPTNLDLTKIQGI